MGAKTKPKTKRRGEEMVSYSPPQVSAAGIEGIKRLQSYAGAAMSLGIPSIEDYFVPSIPGQLNLVIAQTSHGKTVFMNHIASNYARQLSVQERDEVVVFVHLEESVEEAAYNMLAQETYRLAGENGTVPETADGLARGIVNSWGNLEIASVTISGIPIFRVGESIFQEYANAPELTLSNADRVIEYIAQEKMGRKVGIAGIFVDYLQAIPFETELMRNDHTLRQKRLQIKNLVYRLRRMGRKYQTTVWTGVQARQDLKYTPGGKMLIPGVYDGEESSSIGQRADRSIQLWMPKVNYTVGSTFTHNGMAFEVLENGLFIKVGKQRGLPAGRTWYTSIDYPSGGIVPNPDYHPQIRKAELPLNLPT